MKKKRNYLFLLLALSIQLSLSAKTNSLKFDSPAKQKTTAIEVLPTWKLMPSKTTNDLYSVHFITENNGFAVGQNGLILSTSNGGNSWTQLNSGTTQNLNAISFINANIGYIVGDKGVILKSSDGGSSWSALNSGTKTNLLSLYFYNESVGYVGGDSGLVIKTTNQGLNWSKPCSKKVTAHYPCSSLFFLSPTEGFAASWMGLHPNTTDGGVTWTGSDPPGTYGGIVGGQLSSIYFKDSYTGFITEINSSTIYKSTDRGTNWIKKTLGSSFYDMNSICFSSPDTGYVVGYYGKIFSTINQGESWTEQSSPTYKRLNKVFFCNNFTGYAVGASGTILKRTNRLEVTLGNDTTLTCGTSMQMTPVNTNYCGSKPLKYKWTPKWGLSNDTIANPIVTPPFSMTYTLQITTPEGNTASDDITVNVSQLMLLHGADKSIICGSSLKLDSVITFGSTTGKLRYKWTPSTGLNSDTIARPICSASSTTTYTVTITTPTGCSTSDTRLVTVKPVTINAGADKINICGSSVQFDSPTTNYNGTYALRYKWTPSTGLSNDTIARPVCSATSTTNYTVTVTTPSGCTASDNVLVTVNPLTVNAGTDKTTSCGTSVQLDTPTTNYSGTTALRYKWTPSAGLNNDTIAAPTATPSQTTTYTLTITSKNGCTASDAVVVTYISMAKPSINAVTVNAKNKNEISWTKSTGNVASYNVYKESNVSNVYSKLGSVSSGNTAVFVDTTSTPDIMSSKYKVSLVDNCGTETALSDYHKTSHLIMYKPYGNVWMLIWEAYEGFSVSTYNIYRGTSASSMQLLASLSGSNTQYTDMTAAGGYIYYQIEAVSNNTYTSRTNIATNKAPEGLHDVYDISNLLSIIPNPAKNEIRISTSSFNGDNLQLTVYSTLGQAVKNINNITYNQSIDISDLDNGLYILVVRTDKYSGQQKLIIKK